MRDETNGYDLLKDIWEIETLIFNIFNFIKTDERFMKLKVLGKEYF